MSRRDPQNKVLVLTLFVLVVSGGTLGAILIPRWDNPAEITAEEWGPPALAMDTLTSASHVDPLNEVSYPVPDPVADSGRSAGAAYEDVEVLADLDSAQFDRLMEAITEWVAPEAGCTYCHAEAEDGSPDYAAEPPYTFTVARQMIRMTRDLNAREEGHLQPQGVTCFSCHRGRNVPEYKWYEAGDWPSPSERWFQRPPPWIRTATTIREFFPREAFKLYLEEDNRAAGLQAREMALPPGAMSDPEDMALFTKAENTYLFMMQMSNALGVNCNFCHNSRAFASWEQSTPFRVTGWHAINHTRAINTDYILPLAEVLPPERLGPVGDPAKANCMTCHVSQRRPLGGIEMVAPFPGLVAPD